MNTFACLTRTLDKTQFFFYLFMSQNVFNCFGIQCYIYIYVFHVFKDGYITVSWILFGFIWLGPRAVPTVCVYCSCMPLFCYC